jgi:hypothetical protein
MHTFREHVDVMRFERRPQIRLALADLRSRGVDSRANSSSLLLVAQVH